jgi:hypothetical protein
VDRIYFSYGYLNRFRVGSSSALSTITGVGNFAVTSTNTTGPITFVTPSGQQLGQILGSTVNPNAANNTAATIVVPQPGTVLGQQLVRANQGFNLNRYEVGLEKTFLDGRASFYLHAPALDATQNTSDQAIDGFGDLSAGLKFVLLGEQETGSCLTAGFTASAPTARDSIVSTVTTQTVVVNSPMVLGSESSGLPVITGGTPSVVRTTRINPTYLQPWAAGLLVCDRLFVQEYCGALVPTDLRIPVYLNNNLVGGYEVYRGPADAWLTSAAPFVGAQALIPVSGGGFHFPDQVFLSAGLGVRVGRGLLISGSYVTPVAGPRAFENGATVSISYLF